MKTLTDILLAHAKTKEDAIFGHLLHQYDYLYSLQLQARHIFGPNEFWQITQFAEGVLHLTAENHAFASQIRYNQTGLIQKLKTIPELKTINKIKVTVATKPTVKKLSRQVIADEATETGLSDTLIEQAQLFENNDLKATLLTIAKRFKDKG